MSTFFIIFFKPFVHATMSRLQKAIGLMLLSLIILSNFVVSSEATRPIEINTNVIVLRELLRYRVSNGEFYRRKLTQRDGGVTRLPPGGPDPQHH